MSSNDLADFKKKYERRKPLNKNTKLKIANFEFTYKYEILGNFGIAMMSAEIFSEIYSSGDHPSIVLQRMNDSCTPSNSIYSIINQANTTKFNYRFSELYWDYNDQSPLLLIDLNENMPKKDTNGMTTLDNFWKFLNFTEKEIKDKTNNIINEIIKEKGKKANITQEMKILLLDRNEKICNPVIPIEGIDDIENIINTQLEELKKQFKNEKDKLKEAKEVKDERKIKEAEDNLNITKKKISDAIFNKPAFFYLFLFKNPQFGDVDWKDIPFEMDKSQYKVEAKSTYSLTSIIFYHEEHYKLLIIHDSAILISPEGNFKDFTLPPKDDVIILALTYSHVKVIDPFARKESEEASNCKYNYNYYSSMYPFILSSKNYQKEIFNQEYMPAIYYYFEKIKKENIDGFDLIFNYLRFPAFYSYNSLDDDINKSVKNVIKYDVYRRSDEKLKQKIQHFIAKHALIPLWAISISKYLESYDLKDLQTSFLYILNEKFIVSFTTYLFINAVKNEAGYKNLKNAFDITFNDIEKNGESFSQSSSRTNSEDYSNYNELFPTLATIKVDREKIIFDFKTAIQKFITENENHDIKDLEKQIKDEVQTYERPDADDNIYGNENKKQKQTTDGDDDDDDDNDNEGQMKSANDDNKPKELENKYEITQDFLEYQRAIVRVHPYL